MDKPVRKGVRIYRTIRNTVLGIIIAALTAFIILVMVTRFMGGTPSLFGYSMFRVSSGSMTPELEIGDVIITQKFDPMTVAENDIVTYKSESGSMKDKLVTHRVIKTPYKKDGKYYIVTKGDSNISEDDPIRIDQIESKFVTKISALKFLYDIFVTPAGLLIIIGLIIFAFFNEIVLLVKALFGIGYEDEPKESVEEIIERYQKENTEPKNSESEKISDDKNDSGG